MPAPHSQHTADDLVQRYKLLLELGQMVTSEINLDALFKLITDQINQFMNTERCSVFVFDSQSDQLWSMVSTDLEKNEIRIPKSFGVAGWVFEHRRPVIINDAYSDPRFFPNVDKQTGFRTRNILCIPLDNRKQVCIGTLQALNKCRGDFTIEDQDLLIAASHYVAIALENARLYEELKVLDRAKERVIHHLSHELKTPLAIISAANGYLSRELRKTGNERLEKTVGRSERNVRRLLDLQVKIDDILNRKPVVSRQRIFDLIASAADLVAAVGEGVQGENGRVLTFVSDYLEATFHVDPILPEVIGVAQFLEDLCRQIEQAIDFREVTIERRLDPRAEVTLDRNVLAKVCGGLLKNAIENTPDQGMVRVTARREGQAVRIEFQDYGVGIASQNQSMIFGGFFHTQSTGLYTSKKPFAFNAGGTGSDLLRIKTFSERFGFDIGFKSTRCPHIPGDRDVCSGKISSCAHTETPQACREAGSSLFWLLFPPTAETTEPLE